MFCAKYSIYAAQIIVDKIEKERLGKTAVYTV